MVGLPLNKISDSLPPMTTAVQPTNRTHPTWLYPAAWVVGILTALIILYWGLSRAPQNAFDDAYITYRYADNLRNGLGLRYNPGEWVFGTTTPFFALLLGGLGLVVSDLEILGHWLGVLGWLIAALITIPLLRQENRPRTALVAPLLIALQPTLYTSLGMETPLLVALMLTVALFWLRGKLKMTVFLAALLILTRHDSALWLLVIGLEVGRRRHQLGEPWGKVLPWREGIATLLLTLPWFVFALFRYGSPLPNSAAAKIGQNNLMPVAGQSPFALALLETIFNSLPPLTLVILAALFLFSIYLIGRRLRQFWWLILWPLLYALLYTLIAVANFPWYFVPPIAVLFIALALTFGSLLGDDDWGTRPSAPILTGPTIRYATAFLFLLIILFTQASQILNNQDRAGYRPAYLAAANWFRENTPPDASIATIEIGVIGYHSQRPILDTQGLISADMTNHQLGWDDTLIYALNAHQPDYALALPRTAWDIVTAQWWFQHAYQPVQRFNEATIYHRTDPFQSPTTIDISNPFSTGLLLDELTLATTELQPGRPITASLALTVTQSSTPPLRLTTYLVDTGLTMRHGQIDIAPFENLYPSEHWQENDYLNIPLRLTVPDDLPWGAYHFGFILHNTATGMAIQQTNRAGETHLGTLIYGRPDAIPNPSLTPRRINQSWENGIILQQVNVPSSTIQPGTNLPFQLQWNTSATPEGDWTYFIHLINDQGEIVAQGDQRPWNGRWPTQAWQPNQLFWDNLIIPTPPDLMPGTYHLRLGFYIFDQRLSLADNESDFLLIPNLINVQP